MYIATFTVSAFAQWVDMHVPVNGSVKAVAVKDSMVFASAAEGRLLIANSSTNQWEEPTSNLTGKLVNTFLVHGNDIFAGTASNGLFRSTNYGLSWNTTGLSVTDIYAVSQYDSTIYVSSYGGVDASKDNGVTWARINSYRNSKGVLSHNQRLFCISAEVGLHVSDDSGKTWSAAQNGIPTITLSAITEHENDLYISTYGGGVFRSSDNGVNWVSANEGLLNYDVLAFESINNVIVGGTYGGGVFASNIKGKMWAPVNTGVTDFHVYSLAKNDSIVFMATGNGGVWRRPVREFINLKYGVHITEQSAFGMSCYPNPFTASTTIQYSLNNSEKILVEVYDVLGRKIQTLVDGIVDVGQQVTSFNGARLPKGIYYAKLTTSSAQSQIKLVLSN